MTAIDSIDVMTALRLLYRLLTKGQAYVDRGAAYFEAPRQERERLLLERRAAAHGLKFVPIAID